MRNTKLQQKFNEEIKSPYFDKFRSFLLLKFNIMSNFIRVPLFLFMFVLCIISQLATMNVMECISLISDLFIAKIDFMCKIILKRTYTPLQIKYQNALDRLNITVNKMQSIKCKLDEPDNSKYIRKIILEQ